MIHSYILYRCSDSFPWEDGDDTTSIIHNLFAAHAKGIDNPINSVFKRDFPTLESESLRPGIYSLTMYFQITKKRRH